MVTESPEHQACIELLVAILMDSMERGAREREAKESQSGRGMSDGRGESIKLNYPLVFSPPQLCTAGLVEQGTCAERDTASI